MKMSRQISSTEPVVAKTIEKFIQCPNCHVDLHRMRHLCFKDDPTLVKIIDAYYDGSLRTVKIAVGTHRYSKLRIKDGEVIQDVYDDAKEKKLCPKIRCDYPEHVPNSPEWNAARERSLLATQKCQPHLFENGALKMPIDNGERCWHCENHMLHKCTCGFRGKPVPEKSLIVDDDDPSTWDKTPLPRFLEAQNRNTQRYFSPYISDRPEIFNRHFELGVAQAGNNNRRRRAPRKKQSHMPKNFATAIQVKCRPEPGINHPRPHQQKWVRFIYSGVASTTQSITPSLLLQQDAADWGISLYRYNNIRVLRGRVWTPALLDAVAPLLVSTVNVSIFAISTPAGSNPAELQLSSDNRPTTTGHFTKPIAWVWSKVDQARPINSSTAVLVSITPDANFVAGEIIVDIEFIGIN
jgi:hypothetical protein